MPNAIQRNYVLILVSSTEEGKDSIPQLNGI